MPDNNEDEAVHAMEADIRTMAARLGPTTAQAREGKEVRERPQVAAEAPRDVSGPIGASAVAKRLESLLKRSQDLAKATEVIATGLLGPANPPIKAIPPPKAEDWLFGRQMAALDQISGALDSLAGSLERIHRGLV